MREGGLAYLQFSEKLARTQLPFPEHHKNSESIWVAEGFEAVCCFLVPIGVLLGALAISITLMQTLAFSRILVSPLALTHAPPPILTCLGCDHEEL